MAYVVGDILKEVYRFWDVVHTRLPEERLIEIFNRKVKKRLIELRLTNGNYDVKISSAFVPTDEAHRLNINDLSDVIRVESRSAYSAESADWEEVKFADFGDWARYRNSGELHYSVYGTSPNKFLQLNGDYSEREYRIIYETSNALKKVFANHIGIQDDFQPLLVYDVAIEAGFVIRDKSPDWIATRNDKIAYFSSELKSWEKNWKKWTTFDKTQSVGQREAFDSDEGFAINPRIPW